MPRPGPQQRTEITAKERRFLTRLEADGAQMVLEVMRSGLTNDDLRKLRREQLIGVSTTAIGTFVLLMAKGRVALHGTASGASSPERCIDQGYLRVALKELGWPPPANRLGIKTWSPKSQAVEVLTPQGPALVFASLRGGGYTSAGIKKVCQKLGSLALSLDFEIVVLTPSPTRGQQQAQKHSAYLRVIQVVPKVEPEPVQQLRIPKSEVSRLEEPYFNERLAQEALQKNSPLCPPQSIDILQMGRSERVVQALRALQCDGVMTWWQLKRHYGLTKADLAGQRLRSTVVRPCHARDAEDYTTDFIVRDLTLYRAAAHRLAHLAGVAELRRLLGVEPDAALWQVEARGRLKYEEPDAYWVTDTGLVAIEFDTGSYSRQVIERKLDTFRDRAFVRTIWGASSESRVRYMRQFSGLEVHLVEWWQ